MGTIGGCEDVEVCLYELRCEFTVRGSLGACNMLSVMS